MLTIDPFVVAAIERHVEKCQAMIDEHFVDSKVTAPKLKIIYNVRAKRAKVVKDDVAAFSFISLETGDIFKPATWSTPAKHARGNIFDKSGGMARMRWTGPEDLI